MNVYTRITLNITHAHTHVLLFSTSTPIAYCRISKILHSFLIIRDYFIRDPEADIWRKNKRLAKRLGEAQIGPQK